MSPAPMSTDSGSVIETDPHVEMSSSPEGGSGSTGAMPSMFGLGVTPGEALVLGLVLVFGLGVMPGAYHPYGAPRLVLALLLGCVGLVSLLRLGARRDPAALAGGALAVVALAATALSPNPKLSLLGTLDQNGGSLLVVAGIAGWAAGRSLSERGRVLLVRVLIAVGIVNVIVMFWQNRGDFPISGIDQSVNGRAPGLMGNPVFLGALLAGVLALVSERLVHSHIAWSAAVLVVAAALQLSGSRAALAAGILLVLWVAVRAPRGSALVLVFAVAAGITAGALVGTSPSATGRLSTSQSGITVRAHMWRIGVDAFADRPLLGWGPAMFGEATTSRVDLPTAKLLQNGRYANAHNLVVESLVTTGILGLGALGAFLYLAGRRARGSLAAFAIACALVNLFEPSSVAITPLALLALGAAAPRAPDLAGVERGAVRWVPMAVGALCAAIVAGLAVPYLVGDRALERATTDVTIPPARTAARLLSPWPDAADKLALNEALAAHDARTIGDALHDARRAVARDRRDPHAWYTLGLIQYAFGRLDAAEQSFAKAQKIRPWDGSIMSPRYGLAKLRGDHALAAELKRKVCAMSKGQCKLLDQPVGGAPSPSPSSAPGSS